MALFDYKFIRINNGIQVATFYKPKEISTSILSQVENISDIDAVYYYNNPFGKEYLTVFHSSSNGVDVKKASREDIEDLEIWGLIYEGLEPQLLSVFPVYIYGIWIFIILILPKKKKCRV